MIQRKVLFRPPPHCICMVQNGQSADTPNQAGPTTVLVVEADDAVLHSLQFKLEVEGFRVQVYQSAGALLRANLLPARACLLVDYRLPEINGLDLLQRLRALGLTAPAVLMTDRADALLRQAARKAGVVLIEKPPLNVSIADAIRSAIAPIG